ncbi:hypothetical protein L9Z73_01480 [Pseudomonas sp. TNT11]|uniref:ATP-binding protein n=1 Tax=Pseudomonas emilianonis TaxID=2915812 RepID=A0ABT0EBJ8_9PSED|nr:hypothetical protein [Pseudomonas emilianonis]MCK1783081.1 hypothetical protein [Pseudomonas emilianonis]
MATKKNSAKKNLESIDPKIYLAGHNINPAFNILRKLGDLNKAKRLDLIMSLAANKMLPKSLLPVYNETNYYNAYSTTRFIDKCNSIYWTLGIFKNQIKELHEFVRLRELFNVQLLASDSISAKSVLDSVDAMSLSWWSMENRAHLLKEVDKSNSKEYLKKIEKYFTQKEIKNKLNDLLVLSESNSVDFFIEHILERLSEFRNSGEDQANNWASCISTLILPISYDPERELDLSVLYYYRNESIFDQYVLFKNVIIEMYAKGKTIPNRIAAVVKQIAIEIDDKELTCLLSDCKDFSESKLVGSVVSAYTKGSYHEVIELINEALEHRSPDIFGLLEIYARAGKYIKFNFGLTLFGQIANAFSDIVSVDIASREKIDYLTRLLIKFRSESWCKSVSFHLISILSEVNPAASIELSRKVIQSLGERNTPKAKIKNYTLELNKDIALQEIPYHRAIKYELESQTAPELDRSKFPILSDYIQQQSKAYISNSSWKELIDFSIREYLANKVSFFFLPINRLCSEIENLSSNGLSGSFISEIVVLDIYGREINSAYDEYKTELFEEWLDIHETHRPSEIFESLELNAVDEYFLENICTPNQLDNIATYNSNLEVIHERVKILNILISRNNDSTSDLIREKIRIIENLFADQFRTKIETGKLFVDIQALETHRKSVYRSMFDHIKSIEGGIILDEVDDILAAGSSKDIFDLDKKTEGGVPLVAPSSEKTDVLAKIFIQIAKDFSLNENYGLDKYLSAEIRHVVFEEQLRSCFEKTKLITMIEGGVYSSNEFWRTRYSFVLPGPLDKIDEAFKEFSFAVDNKLKQINNRFRVGIDFKKSGDYIFDFSPYYNYVVEISKIVESNDDFDDFFSSLISFMWEVTDEHAKEAQALIDNDLKVKVLRELDLLEQKIIMAKGNVPMNELMQEIRDARSLFNNGVEVVLNWFRFVGAEDGTSFEPLEVIIEAVVRSVDSFYKHKNIHLVLSQDVSDLQLSYREARALFVALFTALENAYRYNFESRSISVSVTRNAHTDTITVINHADASKFTNPEEFIQEQRKKWNDGNSSLSRKEGGSGLYKIHNLLCNSSKGFEFDIAYKQGRFSVIVRLNHEDFISGR